MGNSVSDVLAEPGDRARTAAVTPAHQRGSAQRLSTVDEGIPGPEDQMQE